MIVFFIHFDDYAINKFKRLNSSLLEPAGMGSGKLFVLGRYLRLDFALK